MTKLERIEQMLEPLEGLLRSCCLCGHRCGVARLDNAAGVCRTTSQDAHHARCSSFTLHFGEEPPLVGKGGSGTVFFTHCNLRCVFCQNYQISQLGLGEDVHFTELGQRMLDLQEQGAENINLVTPTHYIFPAVLALREAFQAGLRVPIVYNTNGFESQELLRLLDGIVDVYLPDLKYMNPAHAQKYSGTPKYPEVARQAITEIYRQVGPLHVEDGVAKRGLIIRHLLLPDNLADSYDFLLWLKDAGMIDASLSIMSQYSPRHRAMEFPELRSRVSAREYREVVKFALDLGFENLLVQGLDSSDFYLPDFEKERPFEG